MRFDVRKWLLRYKFILLIAWITISFFVMFMNYDSRMPIFPQWISTVFGMMLALPPCYIAVKQVVPKYLYQKKIKLFIGYILLLAFANAIITYLLSLFAYHVWTGIPMFRSVPIVLSLIVAIFLVNFILISISCVIKIIIDRFFIEQQLFEVEKEKINTELNFLRSQVNPHFLFNVMNTIYFQIDKENWQARNLIEKLSEMLRYQLYDCTIDKIDITKEVNYIKSYVDMQTLRMEKGTDIQLSVHESVSGFLIAPLLILPLVENAFKHISHFKIPAENKIHILLQFNTSNEFCVRVSNTYDKANRASGFRNNSGIGLLNLKRRLELIYIGRQNFLVSDDGNFFEATLKIKYD